MMTEHKSTVRKEELIDCFIVHELVIIIFWAVDLAYISRYVAIVINLKKLIKFWSSNDFCILLKL